MEDQVPALQQLPRRVEEDRHLVRVRLGYGLGCGLGCGLGYGYGLGYGLGYVLGLGLGLDSQHGVSRNIGTGLHTNTKLPTHRPSRITNHAATTIGGITSTHKSTSMIRTGHSESMVHDDGAPDLRSKAPRDLPQEGVN